jgi:RNA polymerase sigma-70 factor (ECF subfamily)
MSHERTDPPNHAHTITGWMTAARDGCEQSLGQLMSSCRDYLLLVAEKEMPGDLRAKVGASDLVQETLMEGQRHFGRFEGRDRAQLLIWLRAILLAQVGQLNRRYRHTLKRELSREAPMDNAAQWKACAPTESPSRVMMRAEERETLQRALAHLPAHYQRVIISRNVENRSFVDIGRDLGLSSDAVRKLWFRSVTTLQRYLGGSSDHG